MEAKKKSQRRKERTRHWTAAPEDFHWTWNGNIRKTITMRSSLVLVSFSILVQLYLSSSLLLDIRKSPFGFQCLKKKSECTKCKSLDRRFLKEAFFSAIDYKQLFDEVFVISRIIKVEVGVISRSRSLRLITLTDSNNYFAIHGENVSSVKASVRIWNAYPKKSCTAVIHDIIARTFSWVQC